MLYHLVPESYGIEQWPSQLLPQWGLTVCSKAWTCSEWALDFQCCMQPLRVRGHCAANQPRQVECCTAAPLVAFSNTFLSHDDRSLASYFCHLVILVWGLSGYACGETISSPFLLRTSSTSLPLALIKPFVSKTVTQPLGELNSIPPSLHPPSWE